MNRREFLMAGAALLLAGCARQEPQEPGRPSASARRSATPSAAPSPTGPSYAVAGGATPIEQVVQALIVRALTAQGFASSAAGLPAGTVYDLTEAIGTGTAPFAIGFAGTLLPQFVTDDDTVPGPDQVKPALASAVAPDVGLLAASPCDGQLVWAVRQGASISSLGDLPKWKQKKAVVPSFAVDRADGIRGLEAVYGAKLAVQTQDDPLARRAALVGQTADLAAFRACDVGALAGLTALDDPNEILQPDPMVVLFEASLGDDQPDVVLAVNTVLGALNATTLASLEPEVADGAAAAAVADRWVSDNLPR